MKKKIVKLFCLFLFLGVFVSVQPASAATIWEPTDSGKVDVNFLSTNTFAIFDDSDLSFTGSKLVISNPFDTIFFKQNGSDWDLLSDKNGNILKLTGSNNFILAYDTSGTGGGSGATWLGNTGYTAGSYGVYGINWATTPPVSMTGIDLKPIPVPASALLLVSGFIGLVGLRSKFKK